MITIVYTPVSRSRCLAVMVGVAVSVCAFTRVASAQETETSAVRPPLMTPKTEEAVAGGVEYLLKQQRKDGSWSAGKAPIRRGHQPKLYPCVMTALAGLALLADGNTPREGLHADEVNRAVDFLLDSATANGLIRHGPQNARPMYGHGFAMLFLAEVHGMERDEQQRRRVREVLEGAIELTVRSQSRAGGWYYTHDADKDEGSVTITQVQGLRACRNAGLHVPAETIERAVTYIRKCAQKDGGIAYSLGHVEAGHGRSLPAITAAAVAALHNAGEYEDAVAKSGMAYLLKRVRENRLKPLSAFRGHEFYGMLYLAQALWVTDPSAWDEVFPVLRQQLISRQNKNGSWDGDQVGPVYGTAIALIVLQLPRCYVPIFQR